MKVKWGIEWEDLNDGDSNIESERLKVPGGWIVRCEYKSFGISLVFVPDALHIWDIEDADKE